MEQDWFPSPLPQPGQYWFRFMGHKPQFNPHKENNKFSLLKFFMGHPPLWQVSQVGVLPPAGSFLHRFKDFFVILRLSGMRLIYDWAERFKGYFDGRGTKTSLLISLYFKEIRISEFYI